MTSNKQRKLAARDLAAETGSKYTVALRQLDAPPTPTEPVPPAKKARTFGPRQILDYLGLISWKFDRARELDLVPGPDVDGRWSQAAADDIRSRMADILQRIGSQPDVGAWRAAEYLQEKFQWEVTPDAVHELARRGLLDYAGDFKGNQLFSGLSLEAFDRPDVLPVAVHSGRRVDTAAATRYMNLRPTDFAALIAIGWLLPVGHIDSQWGRRGNGMVALYRTGDLDELLTDPGIPWDDIRAVPKGGRSLVPKLLPEQLTKLIDRERQRVPGLGLVVEYDPEYDVLALKLLRVPTPVRGQRVGEGIMRRLLAWVDRADVAIATTPTGEFGSDRSRLRDRLYWAGFSDVPHDQRDQVGYSMLRPAWSAMEQWRKDQVLRYRR